MQELVDAGAERFISEGGNVTELEGVFLLCVVRCVLINVQSSGLLHIPQGGCQEF